MFSKFTSRQIIALVGFSTMFFGFGAGALLNWYLLSIHDPLVINFRASLTFYSAIIGDGFILPVINMVAMAFILANKTYLTAKTRLLALLGGLLITAYFHLVQATQGLVNWAMPEPWHWNILGIYHAIYMFTVSAFLTLFYVVALRKGWTTRKVSKSLIIVSVGLFMFFYLLNLDYA